MELKPSDFEAVFLQSWQVSPSVSSFIHPLVNVISKELAMQNSHCNNGTLGLTYLTNLLRLYDLELFFTKFGH